MVVQGDVQRTSSPPFVVQASLPSKGDLSLEPVRDGTRSLMSEEGQCLACVVVFLHAGQALLAGGMIPQAEDGRFGKRPCEMGMAHGGP
jgi:hypothetical protein